MRPTRCALFVGGNKPDWIAKAVASGADHLILDLEDSVPDRDKVASRALVKEGLVELARQGKDCSVRVNPFSTGLTLGDVEGILCPELTEVSLPKVETAADLQALDGMLTVLERAAGLPPGRISTPLTLETARAMRSLYDIAVACPRVRGVSLAAGAGGDAARSVGYLWSKAGTETLYLRSKAVLDARPILLEPHEAEVRIEYRYPTIVDSGALFVVGLTSTSGSVGADGPVYQVSGAAY